MLTTLCDVGWCHRIFVYESFQILRIGLVQEDTCLELPLEEGFQRLIAHGLVRPIYDRFPHQFKYTHCILIALLLLRCSLCWG